MGISRSGYGFSITGMVTACGSGGSRGGYRSDSILSKGDYESSNRVSRRGGYK